jgi:hypothetical protein
MRLVASVVAVLTSVLAGAQASVGASAPLDPVPLAGTPLSEASRLHLLVASNPPFVLDVDSGRVSPIRAPVVMKRGVLSVTAVAGEAGVIVAGFPGQIYVVRARGARPTYVGGGRDVVPSGDGRSAWIKSVSRSACRFRRVGLDGHSANPSARHVDVRGFEVHKHGMDEGWSARCSRRDRREGVRRHLEAGCREATGEAFGPS